MSVAVRFNPANFTVGISRDLVAGLVTAQADPPIPVDGMTFGVASMTDNSPHNGEMHPDGDEVLYLISGQLRITLETEPVTVLDVHPGEGLIVPQGVWHRVDIIQPSQIVYLTPGPGGEYRPLENHAGASQ